MIYMFESQTKPVNTLEMLDSVHFIRADKNQGKEDMFEKGINREKDNEREERDPSKKNNPNQKNDATKKGHEKGEREPSGD